MKNDCKMPLLVQPWPRGPGFDSQRGRVSATRPLILSVPPVEWDGGAFLTQLLRDHVTQCG